MSWQTDPTGTPRVAHGENAHDPGPQLERPRVIDSHEATMAALGHAGEHAAVAREVLEEVRDLLQAQQRPADLETIVLSQATPIRRSESSSRAQSIGVLNPSPVIVYIGVGGAPARVDGRVPSVPAGGALVLPVSAEDLELGADVAGLAAGDAVVYLLRFHSVQPFYLGAI